MTEDIKNIHDKFFHITMKDKENAVDFLKLALPEDISKDLDFSVFDYDDTSYIQNRLKKYFSDIVIKTRIKQEPCDIYVLIEHKSEKPIDQAIFLQLLKYIYSVFEQDQRMKKPFRMIIPLVFYHGKKKWNIPCCLSDLYNCGEDIKKYLLNFCYIVYNTKNLDKDNPDIILQNNIILFSSLIALKSAFEKGVAGISLIIEILKRLREAGINIDKAVIIIEYLLQTKDIEEEDIKKIMKEHTGGEIMPTVLDRYVEKGIEKGSLQEKQLVLIKILSKKFNISDDIKEYIKQCNDPVKLDNAIDNALDEILSADNPDDILACLK